jgi:hypothetical protein
MKFSFAQLLTFFLVIFSSTNLLAQNKSGSKKGGTAKSSSLSQSAVSLSSARLDACMQKNRKISEEIYLLNNKLAELNTQLANTSSNASFFKSQIERARDSVKTIQAFSKRIEEEAKAQLSVMGDSLATLRDFREKAVIERQSVVNDPNVVRVYDFPADIVRIKMLRKFLDEGAGIVLEKNTDDGFTISKIFKDRLKKVGLGKKQIESKVDCSIKMAPHPFNSDRTMFYATTSTKERIGKKPFEDVEDKALSKEYEQKLLKFFDTFLTK